MPRRRASGNPLPLDLLALRKTSWATHPARRSADILQDNRRDNPHLST